jgi:CRP-like cAMP-binding protein
VAGTNKVLKDGDVVFRQGDPADCMYLIRKGALKVFIAKETSEVNLAVLEAGSIVGEMAFFDNKPRSASVKATQTTEVTQITRADFDKLLGQIPKWMVTMMQSLSGRLRTTNERLQKLEETQSNLVGGAILPGQKYPFHMVHRTLRCLSLSLVRDGEKDGREHTVTLESARELWRELVTEEPEVFDRILAKLSSWGMVSLKKNALKQDAIAFVNRGAFMLLTETIGKLAPKFSPGKPVLDATSRELLRCLVESAVESGYESLNVNLMESAASYKAKGLDTSGWASALPELVKKLDLKVSKSGNAILVRITPKDHKVLATTIDQMAEFHRDRLA